MATFTARTFAPMVHEKFTDLAEQIKMLPAGQLRTIALNNLKIAEMATRQAIDFGDEL